MRLFAWFIFCFSLFLSVYSDFDYFQLALQWPPTYCKLRPKNFPCAVPIPVKFTIHGLWPSNFTRDTKCPGGSLDFHRIPNLQDELRQDWPDLNPINGDYGLFWANEWSKHGTCSVRELNPFMYFHTALTLRKAVVLHLVMARGRGYRFDAVSRAISDITGFAPRLVCYQYHLPIGGNKPRAKKTFNWLKEIRLCVDKSTLKFTECPPTLLGSCDGSFPVVLP